MAFLLLALTLLVSGADSGGAALFSDVTAESGIPRLPHGEGAAFQDLDGDGLPEVYLPNVKAPGRLLRNRGGLRFDDVTDVAGTSAEGGIGGLFADLDGDGGADLYVVRGAYPHGTNVFYMHRPGGRFDDVSARANISPRRNGISASACDYDGDGDLDLFVANWGPDSLYRNDGGLPVPSFTDVAGPAGLGGDARSWGSVWADFNDDGRPDLFVARGDVDGTRSRLYLNGGAGTFRDATEASGIGTGFWAMGPVAEDFDGDGDVDLFLANWTGPDQLFLNDGEARFRRVTAAAGLGSGHSVGASAGDVDGDGLADLVSAGFRGPVRTFRNLGGGRFAEATAGWGIDAPARNEGAVLADADGDGDLDLYVTNYDGENRLYRNNTEGGAYFRILPMRNGAPAFGAVVRLYRSGGLGRAEALVARRDLQSGFGFCTQAPPEILVRWPDARDSDVEVVFPDGSRVRRAGIAPGTHVFEAPASGREDPRP